MKNRYLIRRFFAFQIDLMISFIILNILLYVYNSNMSIEDMSFIRLMIMSNLLAFCYFVFSDFFFNKTLGKKIMRLQINGFEQKNKVKLLKQVIIKSI